MNGWEKIALGIGGATFATALVWSGLTFPRKPERPQAEAKTKALDLGRPHSTTLALAKPAAWMEPSPQGGPNWIFDIFTPPVIYYDEASGRFTVTPPFRNDPDVMDDAFELRLLGIRREPFRFQLVSYAGSPGQYVLTLEDLETGRDVFCVPGETLPQHQIRIDQFVESREVPAALREGSTEVFDLVGQAIITDLSAHQTLRLRHSQIAYLEQPSAVFTNGEGMQIVLHQGESWQSNQADYLLERIASNKGQVTVTKSSLIGGDNLQKILQPVRGDIPSALTIHHPDPASDSAADVF